MPKKKDPTEGLIMYKCLECGLIAYASEKAFLSCGFCNQRKQLYLKPLLACDDEEFKDFTSVELAQLTLGRLGR
jgi:hypothetical protein